ncbi:MAG TPA: peptidoglycan-binding protein [Candidatus Brachybacterium intestinipullorum]|uniref:Peptidoglycan-binding protein n=1 Tax=Candidatus Brachybacterium intestinipullorum TaxID=2838512 RepID=A0A9D2TI91_9MICO|nr:peptidoglycan-binding protein [Candidatus Brachybacterium intestinipullorum]
MFRTAPRATHRAPGRAVIDYRGLAAPVGKGVGGAAVIGAVSATAALAGSASATAQAPAAPAAAVGATTAPAAAPAAAPASSSYTSVKLRLGARGNAVTYLQQRLNAHGASLKVDGVFGSATLRAVKNRQSSAGIGVDGVVGPKTWNALSGSTSTAPSSQPKLRQGSRGSAVRTLQSQLNARGASIAVDGVFGSATRSAVRSLQSAAGIGVDGVVGPKTWNALYSSVSIPSGGTGVGSGTTINGNAVISAARAQLGVRYKWGGSTPSSGFDCSGLVYHAYNQAGVNLPRKTAKGYTFGGRIIPKSQAKPGDLVAFTGNDYGHMGIYTGGNGIIDASGSRQQVVERTIWNAPHVFVTYR